MITFSPSRFVPLFQAGVTEMTAPSSTHRWLLPNGRRLELQPGKPLLHRLCTVCNRNFVQDSATGEWFAAIPRMFDFELLHPVNEKWLCDPCPGKRFEPNT